MLLQTARRLVGILVGGSASLPTFWFVAIEAGNPNSFVCVAYGYRRSTPLSLNVRTLSVVIPATKAPLPERLPNDPAMHIIEVGVAMWHGG